MEAALIGVGSAFTLAALGLAFRLGSLDRTVKDVQADVQEAKGQLRDLTGVVGRLSLRVERLRGGGPR